MMKRREFALGLGALSVAGPANANQTILGPPTPMGIPTRVFVNQPSIIRQNCAEWCWAASIAMIFAAHNHPIAQETIVAQTFGGVVCAPSGNTRTIGNDLSRNWMDLNGKSFQSRVVAAYDSMNGINNLNNAIIRDELRSDRPLLYCNTHHAMVITAFDFFEAPTGPTPIQVGVLDPWPFSPAFHTLTQSEMRMAHIGGEMTFVAAVQVS